MSLEKAGSSKDFSTNSSNQLVSSKFRRGPKTFDMNSSSRESREDEFISNVFGPLRNFEETSWLEELVEKSFDDPAFSNDMANGYDLEFWTRYSAPPGRETQENDTELSCVLEAKDHTLMVVARYWHELSAQTAEDVERDQIVRALDCGLAALGPRARLLVITGNPEPPKLVSQYWEEPDLLRDLSLIHISEP